MSDPTNLDPFRWLWTEPGKAALAGALGGIVRWVTLREHWRDGVLSLLVGSICAVYGAGRRQSAVSARTHPD